MKEALDLWAEPTTPSNRWCASRWGAFDATSAQLPAEVGEPLPAQPGGPWRQSRPRTGYGDYAF